MLTGILVNTSRRRTRIFFAAASRMQIGSRLRVSNANVNDSHGRSCGKKNSCPFPESCRGQQAQVTRKHMSRGPGPGTNIPAVTAVSWPTGAWHAETHVLSRENTENPDWTVYTKKTASADSLERLGCTKVDGVRAQSSWSTRTRTYGAGNAIDASSTRAWQPRIRPTHGCGGQVPGSTPTMRAREPASRECVWLLAAGPWQRAPL